MTEYKTIRVTVDDWEFIKMAAMGSQLSMTDFVSSMVRKISQSEESKIEKLLVIVNEHNEILRELQRDKEDHEIRITYLQEKFNKI